jgi:hypothetical protein
MSRNTIKPICFLFLLFSVSSCYSKLTISVLEPGTYILPSAVQKISIYSQPGMPATPGLFDSISYINLDSETNANKIRQGYLDGIYEIMSVSPRFKKAELSDKVLFAELLLYNNLAWKSVDRICSHDSTDALLFLAKAVSYSEEENSYWPNYQDMSHLINNTKWLLFSPFTHTLLASYSYSDTVSISFELLTDPDNLEGVLYQNCYLIGRSFGEKLCPHWNDVERMMYVGPGKELRKATSFIADDKWVQAGAIWNKLAESPHNKKAYRAAFNLSLAFERDDDLDQAYLWIQYADSLENTAASSAYKKILEGRLKVKPLLDQQMAGN